MYSMTKSPDAVCHIARSIYVNRCFFFSCGFDFIIIMYSILVRMWSMYLCVMRSPLLWSCVRNCKYIFISNDTKNQQIQFEELRFSL